MGLAVTIFILTYIAIASDKFPRHWVAMLGGAFLVVFGVMDFNEALTYINWETLGLLSGMFVLVSILSEAGFFKWLAMSAVRQVNYKPSALFVILILLAAFLAMWMDSITVMLFLATLTLQLCRLLDLDPVPMVIAEVCAANTGGAATLVGDPPNVILGTTLGFSFVDFITHTGPISVLAALLLVGYFYLSNRKKLALAHEALTHHKVREIEKEHQEPLHSHLTRVGLTGFLSAVILLIFHIPLSKWSGLHITSAAAALIPASIAFFAMKDVQRRRIILKVDGESILFFTGLFILVGGLEKVHIFEKLAETLVVSSTSGHTGLMMALHWGPGLVSGIVDNVPLALAMSYVLKDLSQIGGMPALSLMVWTLALGVDIGGNITPIGASANVVAYTTLERTYGPIGWKRWILLAAPPTLLVMVVASGLILAKSQIGWY